MPDLSQWYQGELFPFSFCSPDLRHKLARSLKIPSYISLPYVIQQQQPLNNLSTPQQLLLVLLLSPQLLLFTCHIAKKWEISLQNHPCTPMFHPPQITTTALRANPFCENCAFGHVVHAHNFGFGVGSFGASKHRWTLCQIWLLWIFWIFG